MMHWIAGKDADSEARLVDEAYVIWAAAATDCARALRTWFTATSRNSEDAYCTYRAALDREEAAAHDLQLLKTVSTDGKSTVCAVHEPGEHSRNGDHAV